MTDEKKMVEKFQCPGCMLGSDTECGSFYIDSKDLRGFACGAHVPGTSILGGPKILLGMPKPFCYEQGSGTNLLVLIDKEGGQEWLKSSDAQNIPVWKMHSQGYTLVRIARPTSMRYTTLVVDGEVEVPPPAVEVDDT